MSKAIEKDVADMTHELHSTASNLYLNAIRLSLI
jgi:hypothetical protein